MIYLDPGDTISGEASVATTITVSIYGRTLRSPNSTKLDQRQVPAAPTTLYTSTAPEITIIDRILIANPTGTARTIKLWHDGTTDAFVILPPVSIDAGGFAVYGEEGWRFYTSEGKAKTLSEVTATNLDIRDLSSATDSVTVVATNLDVRDLDVAQDDVRVGGMAAHDAAVADNPLAVGGRASDALPTEVSADGDAVWRWLLRNGAGVTALLPHLGMIADPFTLTAKTAQYTTAQTGTALWTPASTKRLVITYFQIQVGGSTAGTVQLWFGAAADTAYTRGTDLALFDGEFAPSATLKPGVIAAGGLWIASAADHILRVTDSAAINPLTVTVWGYEV